MSFLSGLFNRTLFPLFLLLTTPNTVIILWYTCKYCNGSFFELLKNLQSTNKDLLGCLIHIWQQTNRPSPQIIGIIVGYMIWALVLMRIVPGSRVKGPITPKGHTPVYKDNGFRCFSLSIAALAAYIYYTKTVDPSLPSPTIIYDRFDEVLVFLNIFSLLFCLILVLKGLTFRSGADSGVSGNIIFDYYWGTELYPRIFGWDVKVFTNCRFGMTVWPLLVCISALKSYETHGFVPGSVIATTAIQMIYFIKFFLWESGYMRTIDIMLDRAGFYICWGCLVWIPGFYASPSYYMGMYGRDLPPIWTSVIILIGVLFIIINYWADYQKQFVRDNDGNVKVWGSKPRLIRAKYLLENGEERRSILLASGFWGISRHFHYIPEILLALAWSVPAGGANILPYCYIIFLTILLFHRSVRDEQKCQEKYGRYWDEYCKLVPYRIIPYIF